MSRIIYIASDCPIEEYVNPHEKLMSVNEALAAGVTDIHDFLLADDFDRDRPNVLLISDREVNINIDTGEISDGEFDDDFSVFLTQKLMGMRTEKKYCALFQWPRYLPKRAENFIEYLRDQLKDSDELELWNAWLEDDPTNSIKVVNIPASELSKEHILRFGHEDITDTDICYRIMK